MPKTGATRYQKFLKSEKSKIKLKSKKELPKGTNVTKTNFKVKKIVIKEQLKSHDAKEVLYSNKLTIKELLLRVSNSNTNVKQEALNGLYEISNNHPEELKLNLGALLLNVTPLLLHVEKVVRHESLKLLHVVLSFTSSENSEAYFHIISTYLRSAMTHINARVQEDSFLFLDMLLTFVPVLITKYFHKIFPSFMDMISKFKTDSNAVRTLTVNLNSKMTSVRWRIQAFQRLECFLDNYIEHHWLVKENPNSAIIKKPLVFDDTRYNHFSIANTSYTSICQMQCFSYKNQGMYDEEDNGKFKDYIDTLMPLIQESWLEVCPSNKSQKCNQTVINEEASVLLTHLLKITLLLSKTVTLDANYKSFIGVVLQNFPYITNARMKVSEKDKNSQIMDSKLQHQNLNISYLFIKSTLSTNIRNKQNTEALNSVISYLENIIDHLNDNISKDTVKVLHSLFLEVNISWTKSSLLQKLLEKLVKIYFGQETSQFCRQSIFELLCEIALNDNLQHLHAINSFQNWLVSLPEILLESSMLISTVDIMHKYAVCNNHTFNLVIKEKLHSILDNLPHIVISDLQDASNYHKLFSILYHIKCWDADALNIIEKQLLGNEYKEFNRFVLDVLKSRCENRVEFN